MARVPVPVPKLQDLKSRLHHMRLTIIAQYKGLNLGPQAMLVIWSLGLWIQDMWVLGLGSSYSVCML